MTDKPIAIDLYAGLGGWTEGLLATGYYCVGFDIEQHVYGEHRYPGQLVIQDVLTLHGSQFKDAALIVASPPCQEYSYMAMPWTRAKQIAAALRGKADFPEGYTGSRTVEGLNALFNACFRIQREASEAAGHHVPMVVENVRGAQPWVGRARWNWGSFYLWGDVPALMPMTATRKLQAFRFDGSGRSFQTESVEQSGVKAPGMNWSDQTKRGQDFTRLAGNHAIKNNGGSWFNVGSPGQKVVAQNPDGRLKHIRDGHSHTRHLTNPTEHEGVKQSGISGPRDNGKGDRWFQDVAAQHGSKSSARKAASAMIAKIPEPLSRHIGATYFPREQSRAA